MDRLIKVNDNTFEKEVLRSDLLVLVDFWSESCALCRLMDLIFEKFFLNIKIK